MADIVLFGKVNCNNLNLEKRSSTSTSHIFSWEKVEWNLTQHIFYKSYKNSKIFLDVFKYSNIFFTEVIII